MNKGTRRYYVKLYLTATEFTSFSRTALGRPLGVEQWVALRRAAGRIRSQVWGKLNERRRALGLRIIDDCNRRIEKLEREFQEAGGLPSDKRDELAKLRAERVSVQNEISKTKSK